jgi:hypothetical protein
MIVEIVDGFFEFVGAAIDLAATDSMFSDNNGNKNNNGNGIGVFLLCLLGIVLIFAIPFGIASSCQKHEDPPKKVEPQPEKLM